MGCGLDLARVRAAPDPHYGLPMVTCPRCARACVRRHPSRIGWRGRRCTRRAIVGLAGQGAFLLASAAISTMASISMATERFTPRVVVEEFMAVLRGDEDLLMSGPLLTAGALVGWAMLVGVWLSATLRHLGVVKAIVLWGALVQGIILAAGVVQLALVGADTPPANGAATPITPPTGGLVVAGVSAPTVTEAWRVVASAGLITLLTPIGVPLGLAVRASLLKRRSRWIVKSLRRLRPGRSRA
jgi:hypothetical protein